MKQTKLVERDDGNNAVFGEKKGKLKRRIDSGSTMFTRSWRQQCCWVIWQSKTMASVLDLSEGDKDEGDQREIMALFGDWI